MLYLKRFFLLLFGLFCSVSQAHEVNFQQLENCFAWTRLGLRSSEMRTAPGVHFVGSASHGANARIDLNALVFHLTQPDRVAVVQQGGGVVYNLPADSELRSSCERNQGQGGVVLPVSGFLNAGQNSETIETRIRVQVRNVPGQRSELCPISSASRRMNPTGLNGTTMSDQQLEALVQQAVLQHLTWLEENATPENTRLLQSNFDSALKNSGACFSILPMFTGLDRARDRVMCRIQANSGAYCPRSDGTAGQTEVQQ